MSVKRRKELEAKLDVRKRRAALLLVERELTDEKDRMTMDEIGAEVGVTRKTIHEWRTQNKTFIEYVNLLADDFLESKQSVVYRRLMQLIDPKSENSAPSVKAIDLYLRRFGKLTERQVIENRDGGADSRDNDDISRDLEELDELLSDKKDDV